MIMTNDEKIRLLESRVDDYERQVWTLELEVNAEKAVALADGRDPEDDMQVRNVQEGVQRATIKREFFMQELAKLKKE